MSEKAHAANEDQAQPTKKGGGLGGKLLIAAFMAIVIVVEVVAAYCLIPSAEQVAKIAKEKMAKELPATLAESEKKEDHKAKVVEVDLGQYSVTATQPSSNLALRIDFHLFGTVLESEAAELTSKMERVTHAFRDQVLYEIRNADINDLNDPSLGLIKRRILEKSENLFGKKLLRSILFSEFSFIEQ